MPTLFISLLIISFILNKQKYAPIIVFNFIWSLLLIISKMNLIGIETASDDTYFSFFMGGLSFNFIWYLSLRSMIHCKKPTKEMIDIKINNKVFLYLQIIMLIYLISHAKLLFSSLLNGLEYDSIRSFFFSEDNFTSSIDYLLFTYIINPGYLLSKVLLAISLFQPIFNKSTTTLIVINVILSTLISGGRMALVEIAVMIIICFFMFRGTITKKKIGILIFLLSALVLGAVGISVGRGREGSISYIVQEMLIMNFTGSFTFYDYLTQNALFIDNTYGACTFGGVIDPFIFLLRTFGLVDIDLLQVQIGHITAPFINIGDYSYNAMPTMYYFFVTDFGRLGIILGPAIMALVISHFYKRYIRENSIETIVYLLFCYLTIIESPMKWVPFSSSIYIAFIMMHYLVKKR